jgi:hypothetical protein
VWNSRQIHPKGQADPDNQRPDKWSSVELQIVKKIKNSRKEGCLDTLLTVGGAGGANCFSREVWIVGKGDRSR